MLLPYEGMFDMLSYVKWGEQIRSQGLAGYTGIYFPLQYQLFAISNVLGDLLQTSHIISSKLFSLICEVSTVLLLLSMITRNRRNCFLLFYWLNPFFLVLFSLGYCDFQVFLFIACAVWATHRATNNTGHIIAGLFVAGAFLMKPQALFLVLAIGAFGALNLKYARQCFLLLLPSCIGFVVYSLCFAAQGKPILHLAHFYSGTSSTMPCLTAHMLNVWYPLAVFVTFPQAEYSLNDTLMFWGPISYRRLAILILLTALAVYALALSRKTMAGMPLRRTWLHLFTFATLLLPMIMTQGHENHLFIGMALLTFVLITEEHPPSSTVIGAAVIMTVLQTLNLVGLYGLGNTSASESVIVTAIGEAWKSPGTQITGGILNITAWFVVLHFMLTNVVTTPMLRLPRIVVIALLSFLGFAYISTALQLRDIRATFRPRGGLEPTRSLKPE
jgi:hypothetical protein